MDLDKDSPGFGTEIQTLHYNPVNQENAITEVGSDAIPAWKNKWVATACFTLGETTVWFLLGKTSGLRRCHFGSVKQAVCGDAILVR